MSKKYGCVLLAGGSGSRMGGRNKAELEYDRQTFADRIAAELSGTGMPCYVSCASYDQKVPDGWTAVTDCVSGSDGSYIGPMGGIYSCLIKAREDGLEGLFFVPCDAPFYDASLVRILSETIEGAAADNASGREADAVCFRTADGRMQTTFGWYSVNCIDSMKADIDAGKYKLAMLLDEVNSVIVDAAGAGIDERLFSNINYASEYRELRNTTYQTDKYDPAETMSQSYRLPLEEAVDLLVKSAAPITETEEISLMDACGRTLAEDIKAAIDQPPFPRSPLDGYAVRAADTAGASQDSPAVLKVVSEVDAGGCFEGQLRSGEAVRIMTGAPVPDGADAVIGQEDTDYGEDLVRIYEELRPYQNYCRQGEDYRAGDVLLEARSYIGPAEAGIIASAGMLRVRVYRRPRVLLISTGDEVVAPGEDLAPGKIYDSNLYTVGTQLKAWGVDIVCAAHCGDDAGAICEMIRGHIGETDIVVTTGGVSVGKKDIMHDVYRMLGADRIFMHLAIKPGMAMMSGTYKGKHILSMSGNPYAAYVDLHMAVRPVLDALCGNDHLEMQRMEAVLADDYGKKSPTRRFVRAFVRDGMAYIEGHTGGNGDVLSGHNTNAMLDIPAGSGKLKAGDKVQVILL